MSKIELLVQKAQGGLHDIYITNKGEWYRKTYDMRNYINKLHLCNLFYALNSNESGVFFTIVRPLDVGRSGDYEAIWIFIPITIRVNPKDFVNLVSLAQQDMLNGTDNYSNLAPLLNNYYQDIPFIEYNHVEKTQQIAYFLYGQNTDYVYLGSLLEKGIDQPYYKKYQTVFFIDINTRNAIPETTLSQMTDLSHNRIERTALLFPPQGELKGGTEIFVGNTRFSDLPLKVLCGSKVTLRLRRPGYAEVITNISVTQPRQVFSITGNVPWRKIIPFDMFRVVCKGQNLIAPKIFVNGQLLLENHPLEIPEQTAMSAKVEVSKSGYVNYCGIHDISENKTITINMRSQVFRSAENIKRDSLGKKIICGFLYTILVFCIGFILGNKFDDEQETEYRAPISEDECQMEDIDETSTKNSVREANVKRQNERPNKVSIQKPTTDKKETVKEKETTVGKKDAVEEKETAGKKLDEKEQVKTNSSQTAKVPNKAKEQVNQENSSETKSKQ